MQSYFRDVTPEDLQALLPSHLLPDLDPALRVPFLGREPVPNIDLRVTHGALIGGNNHAGASGAGRSEVCATHHMNALMTMLVIAGPFMHHTCTFHLLG